MKVNNVTEVQLYGYKEICDYVEEFMGRLSKARKLVEKFARII